MDKRPASQFHRARPSKSAKIQPGSTVHASSASPADTSNRLKHKKLNPTQRLQQQRPGSRTGTNPLEHHQNQQHQTTPAIFQSTHSQFNLIPTKESSTPRKHTLSVAISATMISHLEKPELRTYAAGQIARILALFEVDEVIIYTDAPSTTGNAPKTTDGNFEASSKKNADPQLFLARLLQYIECPPYMRKSLFPVHRDLQYAGLLHPLETPHHMKAEEASLYREGVTLETRIPSQTLVDVGLQKQVLIPMPIQPNVRVTVKLDTPSPLPSSTHPNYLQGTVASPEEPREEFGLYWGFQVRLANSVSEVLEGGSFEGGYDLTFGISERGEPMEDVVGALNAKYNTSEGDEGGVKHSLIVFGGTKGLEYSVGVDENMTYGEDECAKVFGYYVNPLVGQGSRFMRTEESMLITLTAFRGTLKRIGRYI
ncbi:hypothetical protein HDV05_004502 [Chytridiales sp. JEL 0842]|nr:hypothetical protein HDV05_004502 [Chytridiales sp. JEL 0842]